MIKLSGRADRVHPSERSSDEIGGTACVDFGSSRCDPREHRKAQTSMLMQRATAEGHRCGDGQITADELSGEGVFF